MHPHGGFTGEMSPDAVQTAIDEALFEAYERERQPAYLKATDDRFFKQTRTDSVAFIWDEDSNVGEFQQTGEQEEILNSDSFVGNTKTKRSQKWTKQVPVSDEARRSDKIGKLESIGRNIGDRAKLTQDKRTILDTYADAFDGSINTTPDGDALASNSHTTLKGANVDNLETITLTPDNLWTCNNTLAEQKAQDGEAGSYLFSGLLTPFRLYKTAKEVMNSSLISNSGENALNIFDTDYGEVAIRASIFLSSTYNSASNANTSYHLISESHQIMRKVFYDLYTKMIDPDTTDNDTWMVRAKFHESHFPGSWCGYVGSTGANAS